VIIIIAVLVWVLYTILGKPLVVKYGALRTTAYALASGSAVYFPFGLYRAVTFDYSAVTAGAWISVLYVALGVSIGSYVLWYWLIKNMDVTRVAVFHNLGPIIATSVAVVFLGEPLTWSFIAGGGIVLAGVMVTEFRH
jgi:drug/metabolite transporter (DMT)-like permease